MLKLLSKFNELKNKFIIKIFNKFEDFELLEKNLINSSFKINLLKKSLLLL